MTKEECQEQVAKVICDKSDELTCDECFRLSNGHICEGLDHCRISEKTEEQLKYVLSSAKKDTFLRACAHFSQNKFLLQNMHMLFQCLTIKQFPNL